MKINVSPLNTSVISSGLKDELLALHKSMPALCTTHSGMQCTTDGNFWCCKRVLLLTAVYISSFQTVCEKSFNSLLLSIKPRSQRTRNSLVSLPILPCLFQHSPLLQFWLCLHGLTYSRMSSPFVLFRSSSTSDSLCWSKTATDLWFIIPRWLHSPLTWLMDLPANGSSTLESLSCAILSLSYIMVPARCLPKQGDSSQSTRHLVERLSIRWGRCTRGWTPSLFAWFLRFTLPVELSCLQRHDSFCVDWAHRVFFVCTTCVELLTK